MAASVGGGLFQSVRYAIPKDRIADVSTFIERRSITAEEAELDGDKLDLVAKAIAREHSIWIAWQLPLYLRYFWVDREPGQHTCYASAAAVSL